MKTNNRRNADKRQWLFKRCFAKVSLVTFVGSMLGVSVNQAASTVIAWGNSAYGETNIPSNLTNVVAVAAGSFYGLALQGDGTLRAWGSYWDQDYRPMTVPPGLSNVVAISGGFDH